MVKRFYGPLIGFSMLPGDRGEYVRYSDHEAELSNLKKEASKFAEWVEDFSNDGHIARAARSFLDKLEGRE